MSEPMDRRCTAITEAGARCKAWAMKGKKFCAFHEPEGYEERERRRALAVSRSKRKDLVKEQTIIDVMKSDRWKDRFGDFKTWKAWIAFLESLYGLPFSEGSWEIYRRCTGRSLPPKGQFEEIYAMVGRGGGKSFISALIATYFP